MEAGYWSPPREVLRPQDRCLSPLSEDGVPTGPGPQLIDVIHDTVMDSVAATVADKAPGPPIGRALSPLGRRLAAAALRKVSPPRALVLDPETPRSPEAPSFNSFAFGDGDPAALGVVINGVPDDPLLSVSESPMSPPYVPVPPALAAAARRGSADNLLSDFFKPPDAPRSIVARNTTSTETRYQRRVRLTRARQQRQEGATARRELVPRIPQLTKAAMWSTLVHAELMGAGLLQVVIKLRIARRLVQRLMPIFRLRMWRKRKAAESAELARERRPPGPTAYDGDTVLSMLPYQVLHAIVSLAKPRRYQASEAIMYQDVVDAGGTCYVEHGHVEVLVRRNRETTVVATLGPGSVIGSMAMITGGPRSATVRAKTDVLAWECDRASLLSLLDSRSELADAVRAAMAEVLRIHESNLQKMWLEKFSIQDLMSFGAFDNVNEDAVRGVRSSMNVRVAQPGERLIAKGQRAASAFLLLRGSVRVLWPASQPLPQNCFGEPSDFTEAVAMSVDIPAAVGRDAALTALRNARPPAGPAQRPNFKSLSQSVYSQSHSLLSMTLDPTGAAPSAAVAPRTIVPCVDEDELAASRPNRRRRPKNPALAVPAHQSCIVSAKALVGLQSVVLNEESAVDVVVHTNSDVLVLDKNFAVQLAVAEAAAIGRLQVNCHQLRAPWLQPITRNRAMRAAVSQLPLRLRALFQQLPSKGGTRLHAQPFVVENDRSLTWRRGSHDVFFILEGAVSTAGCGPGAIWPPLHMAYFGEVETSTFVRQRLAGWRLPRTELVLMIDSFGDYAKQLEEHLADQFAQRFNAAPRMEPVNEKYDMRYVTNHPSLLAVNRVESPPRDRARSPSVMRLPRTASSTSTSPPRTASALPRATPQLRTAPETPSLTAELTLAIPFVAITGDDSRRESRHVVTPPQESFGASYLEQVAADYRKELDRIINAVPTPRAQRRRRYGPESTGKETMDELINRVQATKAEEERRRRARVQRRQTLGQYVPAPPPPPLPPPAEPCVKEVDDDDDNDGSSDEAPVEDFPVPALQPLPPDPVVRAPVRVRSARGPLRRQTLPSAPPSWTPRLPATGIGATARRVTRPSTAAPAQPLSMPSLPSDDALPFARAVFESDERKVAQLEQQRRREGRAMPRVPGAGGAPRRKR